MNKFNINSRQMKHVSLLTIHLGFNFGSILQTVATIKTVEKHNCTVEVINYIPERCTLNHFFKSKKSFGSFVKTFITFPIFLINRHIYNSFLLKYARLSAPIYKNDDFVQAVPKSDIYMTGSDQVWNSVHNEGLDRRYYFDGFPMGTVKVAYASSIGRECLKGKECAEVKRMLATYKTVSVREASAMKMIESMGYEVCHLLDPTFMLNSGEWEHYMTKRKIREAYILVYLPYNVHDKDIIYRSVKKIAMEKKLKIVSFSWHIIPDKDADKTIFFANPGDFVSLMYHADCIVTNSFHGTAFSVNLNKQFFVYLPTDFGSRIKSILELCHLENRLLGASEIISGEKICSTIDYIPVNAILDKEREKAHAFLRKALEE